MVRSKFGGINLGWYMVFMFITIITGAAISYYHTEKIIKAIKEEN